MKMRRIIWPLLVILILVIYPLGVQSMVNDTYFENFDGLEDDATINGVDSWVVDQGDANDAKAQDSTTYNNTGNSLELSGEEITVNVSRSATYGNKSPCWIEFYVNAGVGNEVRSVPTGKIAAITFDYTGKIYASNGSTWEDTGKTFVAEEWYRVLLKVDFDDHEYDIFVKAVTDPETELIADKTDLAFIDTSIDSLSQIGLEGVYSTTRDDDTYIDDLCVYFIDRLVVITALQNIKEDTSSEAITVQLHNDYSEPQTAWTDIILDLKSTSGTGEFSLDETNWVAVTQITLPKNAQQVTFYYKDSTEGTPIITVEEYADRNWTEATQMVTVSSEVASFAVAATTPQVAGRAFPITITARNDEGGLNESYNGEVSILANYISPGVGTLVISPAIVSEFSDGMIQIELEYPDCGVIEIIIQDTADSSKTGTSGEILFIPSSFTVFIDTPQVVKKTFELSVTAINQGGEVTPNYNGPVNLTIEAISPDDASGGSISVSSLTSGDFTDGVATKEITYDRWGIIQIRAADSTYSDKTGISGSIDFIPNSILVEVEPPSSDRDFYYVSESIGILVSALDENGEVIPNYQGLVNISTTLGLSLAELYQFQSSDEGKHAFITSISSSGYYKAAFEDTAANLTGESPQIQVKNATIQVISIVSTIGTAEVTIQLVDDDGNIIDSESELFVQIVLEEEYDNDSAYSSTTKTPVAFSNGVAKILISNNQAETVTILPSSEYDFNIKKGTITFGRIAKTGIGALMWREIKD